MTIIFSPLRLLFVPKNSRTGDQNDLVARTLIIATKAKKIAWRTWCAMMVLIAVYLIVAWSSGVR
jgi:hypothetical protein